MKTGLLLVTGLALVPAVCLTDAGCGQHEELRDAAPAAPRQLQVAGRTITIELALTEKQRTLGLMHRTQLDPEAGMLFVFPDSAPRTFWMHDTLIPLDVVFMDQDGLVLNIAHGEPMVEVPGLHSKGPARLVLELNAGWCAAHGLLPGQRIAIPPEILPLGRP